MSDEKAGRALDERVARGVMGWVRRPDPRYHAWYEPVDGGDPRALSLLACDCWRQEHGTIPQFAPSTSISHAWLVVEKLEAAGWLLQLTRIGWEDTGETRRAWEAQFYNDRLQITEDAPVAPLAICLAALSAVAATPGKPSVPPADSAGGER